MLLLHKSQVRIDTLQSQTPNNSKGVFDSWKQHPGEVREQRIEKVRTGIEVIGHQEPLDRLIINIVSVQKSQGFYPKYTHSLETVHEPLSLNFNIFRGE